MKNLQNEINPYESPKSIVVKPQDPNATFSENHPIIAYGLAGLVTTALVIGVYVLEKDSTQEPNHNIKTKVEYKSRDKF